MQKNACVKSKLINIVTLIKYLYLLPDFKHVFGVFLGKWGYHRQGSCQAGLGAAIAEVSLGYQTRTMTFKGQITANEIYLSIMPTKFIIEKKYFFLN